MRRISVQLIGKKLRVIKMKSTIAYFLYFIVIFGGNLTATQDYMDLLNEINYGYDYPQKTILGNSKNMPQRQTHQLMAKSMRLVHNGIHLSDPDFVSETRELHCPNVSRQIHKMGLQVRCMLRETLVKLIPEPGYFYTPSVALVKRCIGMCGTHSQSCMKVGSFTTKKVQVLKWSPGSFYSKCWELEVEEHTQCKCGCDLMQEHCNAMQIYSSNNCTCKCRNIDNQRACELDETMVWNPNTCRCNCKEEQICNTGLFWVPSMCKCAKMI